VISRLLTGPAVAFAKTKHSINAATLAELEPSLQRELEGQSILLQSHDFREGASAFQQHRGPTFTDS
jgi:enoyl-CoA hydratase